MTTAPGAAAPPAQPVSMRRTGLRSPLKKAGRWLAILLMMGTFGFPLYWTITMSFKPQDEWNPPGKVFWFPAHPTNSNYTDILQVEVPGGRLTLTLVTLQGVTDPGLRFNAYLPADSAAASWLGMTTDSSMSGQPTSKADQSR